MNALDAHTRCPASNPLKQQGQQTYTSTCTLSTHALDDQPPTLSSNRASRHVLVHARSRRPHALDALSTRSWDAGDGGETCTRTLTMHALKVLTGWWGRRVHGTVA